VSVLITFDLDNTLWDVAPVIMRAEYAMESWFEERFPGFSQQYSLSAREALKQKVLAENPAMSPNLTALRLSIYKLALSLSPCSRCVGGVTSGLLFSSHNEW
jgi:FMN phosphatase YigB (HAD superfamily)